MSRLDGFVYRTLCVYFDKNRIGCLLFYGDGTYISHRKKVMFAVSPYFEENIFEHIDLGIFFRHDTSYITEQELKDKVMEFGDYRVGLSEPYRYPFHHQKQDIFRTFIKNNDLKDINQILLGDD